MDTGYEVFSQYYDGLTENVDYKSRAAYFHGLIEKYKKSTGNVCGSGY